jgi:hypothetical protein
MEVGVPVHFKAFQDTCLCLTRDSEMVSIYVYDLSCCDL